MLPHLQVFFWDTVFLSIEHVLFIYWNTQANKCVILRRKAWCGQSSLADSAFYVQGKSSPQINHRRRRWMRNPSLGMQGHRSSLAETGGGAEKNRNIKHDVGVSSKKLQLLLLCTINLWVMPVSSWSTERQWFISLYSCQVWAREGNAASL